MTASIVLTMLLGAGLGEAPPPPPLTLKSAIAEAQHQSPVRAGAAAVADGAAAAALAAGRFINPWFEFRTENWTPSPSNRLPLDLWVTVSQPLELGGKRSLRRGVAEAERDSLAADLASIDRQVAQRTTQVYLQALRFRGAVETLMANRDGLATIVKIMRERVDEGYVAESDLLRVEAESARFDIDLSRAALDLDRSLDSLTALLGRSQRIEAAQLVTPELIASPARPVHAIAAALDRHPDLLAASARVNRAQQVRDLEESRRLPDPAVTAGFKRSLGIGTVVAAVSATVPLFDRNTAARATAAAGVRTAEAHRDALRARLMADTTSIVAMAHELSERASMADTQLLAPAASVREAARAAFREGSVDVLKLIDAERVYGDVRRLALDLRLEAIGAAVDARIALNEEFVP